MNDMKICLKIIRIQAHNNFVCFRWLSEKARNTSRAGQDQGILRRREACEVRINVDHIFFAKGRMGLKLLLGLIDRSFFMKKKDTHLIKNDIYLIIFSS